MSRPLLLLALFGAAACGGGGRPSGREICDDGYDNDGDGAADCVDSDCAGAPIDLDGDGVAEGCPELCGDGLDNDGDGLLDCEDPACDGSGCAEVCTDGRDNDKDTAWDCDDSDCASECDADVDGSFNEDFGGDDCDDANPTVFPGAPEVCDGLDNNCNALVDQDDPDLEWETLISWYADADGDGYGQEFDAVDACLQPAGRVELPGDCHDADVLIHPAALEVCDGVDNNCDGLLDAADPGHEPASAMTWYPDGDGDGFGAAVVGEVLCTPPAGHVTNGADCDDTDPRIGSSGLWVLDGDGDDFGAGAAVGPAGCVPPGANHVSESLPADCNDADGTVNPGAVEVCGDGRDADCDGLECPHWFEGFEVPFAQPPWVLSGTQPWIIQALAHTGVSGAASGPIDDLAYSVMTIDASFPAGGAVVFWHRGDTENGYDFFRVSLNGTEVLARSGLWGWTRQTVPVGPGAYTIEFAYEKDASLSSGSDTVYVDDLELQGGTP